MRPQEIREGDGILALTKNPGTKPAGRLEVHTAYILTVTKATPDALEATHETRHEIITLTAALDEATGEYGNPQVTVTLTGMGDPEPEEHKTVVATYPLGAPIKPGDPTPIHGCTVGAYGRFKNLGTDETAQGVFTTIYEEAAVLDLGYGECIVALNDAYDNTIDTVAITRNGQHFCDVLPLDSTTEAALSHVQDSDAYEAVEQLTNHLANVLGEHHIETIMDNYVLDAIDVARLDGNTSNIGETILKRTHNGVNTELSHLLGQLEEVELQMKTFQKQIKESIAALEDSPLHDPNLVAEYKENI
jgi:hypothetical protein